MKNVSVKSIYFYLVSFISLLVVLFTLQSFLGNTLNQFVLRTTPTYTWQPPFLSWFTGYQPYIGSENLEEVSEEELTSIENLQTNDSLTKKEQGQVRQWLHDYQRWQTEQKNHQKQNTLSITNHLVSLVIFTPVFLYHFRQARKND